LRAWKIAFILLVHGLFPNIWKTKASDMLCIERISDDATRAYLLKTMYNIKEKDPPSIYERMSDRELATWIARGKKKNQTNAAGYLVK